MFLVAFDIGQSIDLEQARADLGRNGEPQIFRHKIHAPDHFQIRPPPLRLTQQEPARLAGREARVELLIYDFGAVSVAYTIRFEGALEPWIDLGASLSEDRDVLADARRRIEALVAAIHKSVAKYAVADPIEDYVLFEFERRPHEGGLDALVAAHASPLARLLRAERGELSEQEIADALSTQVAFSPADLALIDWNGAVLFDDEPADVRAVLEFANVQLLELRFLDAQLDRNLDAAFLALDRRSFASLWRPAAFGSDLDRVSRLQVDGAILFERVHNALKLLGDQYLARVYRHTSARFRLSEWNAGILRKLETLDGIYQKIQDRAEARRMEFLEWLIVILFVVSTVLPFLVR